MQDQTTPLFISFNAKNKLPDFSEIMFAQIISNEIRLQEVTQGFTLISYVIMPNHIHLFLIPPKNKSISRIMQKLKSTIYHQFRKKLGIADKFWQKSFFITEKNNKNLINITLKYIRNNPKKAGLGKKYSKLPYFYENKRAINAIALSRSLVS
jgi:REP element-mobilizing transposase RayT